jgi:hypothetical protein
MSAWRSSNRFRATRRSGVAVLLVLILFAQACDKNPFRPDPQPDPLPEIAFVRQGTVHTMFSDGTGLKSWGVGADAGLLWSPDGRSLAVTVRGASDHESLRVLPLSGAGERLLTDQAARPPYPAWSPNGTRIAYTGMSGDNWEVEVVNADGSNARNLTNHPAPDWGPHWSADGSRILFWSQRSGARQLYVMNADGTNVVLHPGAFQQHESFAGTLPASLSPAGDRVAYWARSAQEFPPHGSELGTGLFIASTSGAGEPARAVWFGGGISNVGQIVWAPDGSALASQVGGLAAHFVIVVPADASGYRRIAPELFGEQSSPTWSPDANRLLFSHSMIKGSTTPSGLFVANADGSGVARLTSDADVLPSWSPIAR